MPSAQEGQVYRLANGTWAYRYWDGTGKRPQKGGFKTRKEARDALNRKLEELRLGTPSKPHTVSELVAEYLD